MPGSALPQAEEIILSQISTARTVLCLMTLPPKLCHFYKLPSQCSWYNGSEESGKTKSQGASSFTAFIKSSVMPTLILALVILPASFLLLIKSKTSGCQQFKISISAPRLLPPCSIKPVTKLYKDAQDTLPLLLPLTPFT